MDGKVIEASSLSLSFCLFVWLSTYLPTYLSMYPSLSLSVCLSVCLSTSLPLSLSLSLSLSLPLSLPPSLPRSLSLCLSIYLSNLPLKSIYLSKYHDNLHMCHVDSERNCGTWGVGWLHFPILALPSFSSTFCKELWTLCIRLLFFILYLPSFLALSARNYRPQV